MSSIYDNPKIYTVKLDLRSESGPKFEHFLFQEGEHCEFLGDEVAVQSSVVATNLKSGNITALDKKIIELIATFEYLTSRQISDLLAMLEVETNPNTIRSSLKRLRKNILVNHFRFSAVKPGPLSIFMLNKHGSELAKVLGVSHNYSPLNVGAYVPDIRRVLELNQIMISFLKSGFHLDFIKRRTCVSAKSDGQTFAVFPSLTISVDGEILMYEVVRRSDLWQYRLEEKLHRYKQVLDNWQTNSWRIPSDTVPELIIAGESTDHNKEIAEILLRVGLDTLFTEDNLICGKNFYSSLYEIDLESGKQTFYKFEIPD